jgi:flagellin
MRINHNIAALNTYRQLSANNTNTSKAIEKLSSGLRINRAGDDAAGLAISEKMRGQIRGLEMASKNAQDGVSLIQTAEGALSETHSILQRIRELAVQSANDTNDISDRGQLQKEVKALIDEVDRIAKNTEFNGKVLLDGSLGLGLTGEISETSNAAAIELVDAGTLALGSEIAVTQTITYGAAEGSEFTKIEFSFTVGEGTPVIFDFTKAELEAGTTSKEKVVDGATFSIEVADAMALAGSTGQDAEGPTDVGTLTYADNSLIFHIGANEGQNLKLGINDLSAEALNIGAVDISTQANADAAISTIQSAIDDVSKQRSFLGATQNRLEHTIANLGTAAENLTAAESRIRDVDMAKEIMEFTKTTILTQAAQAMLAQANQQPQGVLQLLR